MNPDKPNVLAILPGIIPSTSILVIKPLLQLRSSGYIKARIVLESTVTPKELGWADVAVFCRNTEPLYGHNLESVINSGIPYIYDLDDNFFEIHPTTQSGAYHRDPDRIALLREYLRNADLVRVYSKAMLDYIRPLNENVIRTFGPIDLRAVEEAEGKPGGAIKLVYSTSSGGNDLLPIILPAVERILREYDGRVEAHFLGVKPGGVFAGRHFHFHRFIMDYDRFLRRFSRAHYDIGLAPLRNDIFHRSKTNNKFREYGACGIAGVYSDVEAYSTCVQHEKTGLLVDNHPDSWQEAVVRLIENPGLLKEIKRQAREYVRRNYSQEKFESLFFAAIRRVANRKEIRTRISTCRVQANQAFRNGKSGPAQRLQSLRTQIKSSGENPVSIFFRLIARFFFVRRSLLRYKVAAITTVHPFRYLLPRRRNVADQSRHEFIPPEERLRNLDF